MSQEDQRNLQPEQAAGGGDRRLSLPLPKQFSGIAEDWPKWRARFDRYRISTSLSQKSREEQVSLFLFTMGDIADDLLATMQVDEATVTYDDLVGAFNAHFNERKNKIHSRAKFNKRVQRQGEEIDIFIQDLHKIADECEYGTLKEELIRDRIVVGVADDNLSDKLQAMADLTLAQAVQHARQAETRKQSQALIRDNRLDFVRPKHHSKKDANFQSHKNSHPSSTHSHYGKQSQCGYCGREPHPRSKCPARNDKCTSCDRPGHWSVACLSKQKQKTKFRKTVHQVSESESSDEESFFLGSLSKNELEEYWSASIAINDAPHHFKLDTGASVTVIGDTAEILKTVELGEARKTLRGPGGTDLKPVGTFMADLCYKGKHINETIYVLKDQPCSLLGKRACIELGLLARIDAVDEPSIYRDPYPGLFGDLKTIKPEFMQPYKIPLIPDPKPVCLYTPRKIAHPLIPKVKKELEKMQDAGVISPVTQPTEWCSGMVIAPKPGGAVRVCVDLTQLNKAVQREVFPMSSVDDNLAKLKNSKIFTKLDAKSGFWQIPLDDESKLLTTFVTPFGRFCFNRLPFGISSAPEIYQRMMSQILEGLEGVICHIDDVLIHAEEKETHDQLVHAVLKRLHEAGITLNDKCEFAKSSVKFLGHIIDGSGIRPDPKKLEAIQNYPAPTNVTELQRFMGMVNQLAKFLPNLSKLNAPLRQLLHKEAAWLWDEPQETSFQTIKNKLLTTPVLAHYDPQKPTIIAADACGTGIGAVLLQVQADGSRRPVCFHSRSLSETEKNYATIEKEALAVTWACERMSEFVLGLEFTVETDHKPLVPLLNEKELHKMPPRIQRFKLRMLRFNPNVVHVSGKSQITADALSRAPVGKPETEDIHLIDNTETTAAQTITFLPASSQKLDEIRAAQKSDEVISQIRSYCTSGWPGYMPENIVLQQYWSVRGHLTLVDDLLLYNDRLVIPLRLRVETLHRLHEGHLGISKTRRLAKSCVWWPTISSHIEEMVKRCRVCAMHRPEKKEPLLPSSTPKRPWERLAMDLFELRGETYLLVVDYFSRWPEIRLLNSQSSSKTIQHIKSIFATHGIPDVVVSDNGGQFGSQKFANFADTYCFSHVTSSPKYPQSNGEAERSVQTVKNLLRKASDPYLALLMYRVAPLQNGYSPAQLLMGRQLKTTVPVLPSTLLPSTPDYSVVMAKEAASKEQQRHHYNTRHGTKDLPPLQPGDSVWVRDMKRPGEVIGKHRQPRSYDIATQHGSIRRNRSALIPLPDDDQPATPTGPVANTNTPQNEAEKITSNTSNDTHEIPPCNTTTRKSNRSVKKPSRLIEVM